jgi:AcrR family transcriptional regulator
MPRTKEQFSEMREKSKRLIMDSALKLFSTNGFHTTSINKIAVNAGVAIGLVYNYFKSKEDLLDAIIKDSLADFNHLMDLQMKEALGNDNLNAFIDTVFDNVKLKIDSWRLIISIMLQPEVAEIGRRNMASFSNHIYQFTEAYFRKKGDTTSEKKARILDELLHAASLSYILSGDEEALELIKNELIKKFIL